MVLKSTVFLFFWVAGIQAISPPTTQFPLGFQETDLGQAAKDATMKIIRHADGPGKHRRVANAAKQPEGSILHVLMAEVLICIIDLLDLHDKFWLSQTCRVFHLLAKRDWNHEFSLLDEEQRESFLSGLAWHMPDHWMCRTCRKIHSIDKADIPRHGQERPNLSIAHMLDRDVVFYGEECRLYKLCRRHVEMALKLTRMGGPNAGHLRKLMSPFSLRRDALPFFTIPGYDERFRAHRYRATPKIVSGRFLLKTEWEYRSEGPNADGWTVLSRRLCSHPGILLGMWEDAVTEAGLFGIGDSAQPLLNAYYAYGDSELVIGLSHRRYDGRELELFLSCPCCATDCRFKFSRGRSIFQSWRAFDFPKSRVRPIFQCWRGFDFSESRDGRGGAHSFSGEAERLGFEEGGVRRMFEEATNDSSDV